MRATGEADRLLLGGLLEAKEPKRLLDGSGLQADDFGDVSVRGAFELLKRRADHGRACSAFDLWQAGFAAGLFAEDDRVWLQGLEAANALTEEQWQRLADERRNLSRRRAIARTLRATADELDAREVKPGHIVERLDAAKSLLVKSYAANRTAELDPVELLESWDARVKAGRPLLTPTRVEIFDGPRGFGGWAPNLNLVVGAPGVGKSALLGAVILAQLEAGERVGLFGLEDGHRWLTRRAMARDLGLPLRAIGSASLSPDEWLKATEAGARLSALFKNLLVYKWGGISRGELVRWSLAWIVNEGVRCVYVDNATSMNHRGDSRQQGREEAYNREVSLSAEAIRDIAHHHEVPHVVLAHTRREYLESRVPRAPQMHEVADASVWEKVNRFFLGVWAKWGELRCTVQKNTEGEAGVTFGFDFHREAALVDAASGRVVDLADEAKKEAAQREERGDERAVEKAARRAELRKAMKKQLEPEKREPEKKPEPAEQPTLPLEGAAKS